MQEINETIRENNKLREIRDSMTGPESAELSETFLSRRTDAFNRQAKRVADGIESTTIVKETRNFQRNDPCPCGSGKKYKKCCGSRMAKDDDWID